MREDLFHKIWEFYSHEFRQLRTSDGTEVEILHPGTLNTGDGPDFSSATIKIDSLIFHGDIELHIRCADWYAHKHHTDINYNKVVLHLVLEETSINPVQREDGTFVSSVSMAGEIPDKMIDVIRRIHQKSELKCHHFISDIHPHVLHEQLKIASEQYFEQKIHEIKRHYDSSLPISQAWVRMVFLSWCDGLGIPKNRENMVELGQFIWKKSYESTQLSLHELMQEMTQFTQLTHRASSGTGKSWDFSGSHPGNRPTVRIKHVANLLFDLKNTPFREFALKSGLEIVHKFSAGTYCGKQRRDILIQITLMPAISVLGEILGRQDLIKFAQNYWFEIGFNAPQPIKKPFQNAGISQIPALHGPGYVYQLKHYCNKLACEQCLIFKSALRG